MTLKYDEIFNNFKKNDRTPELVYLKIYEVCVAHNSLKCLTLNDENFSCTQTC